MSGDALAMDLDPLGFVTRELAARGALIERGDASATVVISGELAHRFVLPEAFEVASAPQGGAVGCGLGSPLLDQLVTEVRATVPVASVTWQAEPPRVAVAERLAARLVVRNGVADVLGVSHVAATYLAGVFAWTAEADDRYQGIAMVVAHAATGDEPDPACIAGMASLIVGGDAQAADEDDHLGSAATAGFSAITAERSASVRTESDARGAICGASTIAKRAGFAIGPRLDEVGAAVARRRDRERGRIDEYFASLIGEAKRPRRQVAPGAIEARVAALSAEHTAKLRDLAVRYTLRVHIEPVALAAITTRAAEIRLRLRRRKGERELALRVPPSARTPDALACVACPGTTSAPLLCDDALHVLCETCAPEAVGRPRCPGCRTGRSGVHSNRP